MKTNNIIIKDGQGKKLLFFDNDKELYTDQDIYSEDTVENFNENDEISLEEEGFMVGYLAA